MRVFFPRSVLLLLALSLLTACGSDEKEALSQLQSEFSAFVRLECGSKIYIAQEARLLQNKLDLFITKYPKGSNRSAVEDMSFRLKDIEIEKRSDCLLTRIRSFDREKHESYADALQELDKLSEEAEKLSMSNKVSASAITNAINTLREKRDALNWERRAYSTLISSYKNQYTVSEADDEIEYIEDFLNEYENCLMKDNLLDRIEQLKFTKFRIKTNTQPSSVRELNDLIEECKAFAADIKKTEYRSDINEKIFQLNQARESILREEKNRAMIRLEDLMTEAAKRYNREVVHSFCQDVAGVSIQQSDKNEYPNRTRITRVYNMQTKGGFLCGTIYRTIIRVTADVFVDLKSGVSMQINSVELLSDIPI
jgi:hypothetical protein